MLGKFGLVWFRAIFARPETGQSGVPDKIFGTGTGNRYELSISVWSRSRLGPDGPCTIYLFIYLFKIEDGGLVWDGTASSSRWRARCTAQDAQRRSNEGCSSPRGERCVDVDEWWGGRAEKHGEMGY